MVFAPDSHGRYNRVRRRAKSSLFVDISVGGKALFMAEKTQYGAEQIQVLEGLEPVRKRPGMYIGGTGVEGLHHLVWEIVNNGIDETLAGHATEVSVKLLADGGVRVWDNGRGIPTDIHSKTGKSTVE